jgi:hypothetical protein
MGLDYQRQDCNSGQASTQLTGLQLWPSWGQRLQQQNWWSDSSFQFPVSSRTLKQSWPLLAGVLGQLRECKKKNV